MFNTKMKVFIIYFQPFTFNVLKRPLLFLFFKADTDRNIYMAFCLNVTYSFCTNDKSFHLFFRCPECGRTPPGQKKAESFRKMIGRKLSVRKSVSFKSSSSNRSRESRDMGRQQRQQQQQNWVMQVGSTSHVTVSSFSFTRSSRTQSVQL